MIRKILEWISPKLPQFTVPQEDGSPYLTRHYILGNDFSENKYVQLIINYFNIYLHKFHASDFDSQDGVLLLHNHPWDWSFSFVLCGGYLEIRMKTNEYEPIKKIVLPFRFNFINSEDFHRVVLIEQDAWSIFIRGKRKPDGWYFFNPETRQQMHYTTKPKAIA